LAFFNKSNRLRQDKKATYPEEKNSYEIIKWEVEVGEELLQQPTNLMPIHQFGNPPTMGQYAADQCTTI
jgi:hypothetical protein